MLASLPALVEKIRAVCQRVLQRMFPPPPTINLPRGVEKPPRAPTPASDVARAVEEQQLSRDSSTDR